MLDNKYIKHPYHCEQCNALTPHLAVNASDAESKADAESEKKQWKLGVLMEYLMTLLFKGDHNVPGFMSTVITNTSVKSVGLSRGTDWV